MELFKQLVSGTIRECGTGAHEREIYFIPGQVRKENLSRHLKDEGIGGRVKTAMKEVNGGERRRGLSVTGRGISTPKTHLLKRNQQKQQQTLAGENMKYATVLKQRTDSEGLYRSC